APATNAKTESANLLKAIDIALLVPIMTSGFSMEGANPIRMAIRAVIVVALASYEKAPVAHTILANTKSPSMRCQAAGHEWGVSRAIIASLFIVARMIGIEAKGSRIRPPEN